MAQSKPVILVTSFGTSFNSSRCLTIGAIESSIRECFPNYDVRRAFTSKVIIKKLAERDGIVIDSLTDAMDKLVKEGAQQVIIQPTHFLIGQEFEKIQSAAEDYKGKINQIALSNPLLTSEEDYLDIASALAGHLKRFDDGETALCLMGHGTSHEANESYATMQAALKAKGLDRFFLGTVEAKPSCQDVIAAVKEAGLKKAVITPFMLVAGDHANNDMADLSNPESWASQFSAAGIQTNCLLEGCGQIYEAHQIYIKHLKATIAQL